MKAPHVDVRFLHVSAWFVALVALAVALVSALLVGGARTATTATGLIAFTRYDGIYVMRGDGSGVRAIRRGSLASSASGLAWSPDGRKLAFVARDSIWVMDARGRDLVRVFAADASLRGPGSPTWSPRDNRIAFTATHDDEHDRDVWVVNTDGSNLRRLARTPRLTELEVDWSPSGSRLAVSTVGGYFLRLHVMNANGTNVRTLTGGWTFQAATPDWSPDGRRIAFTRWGGVSLLDAEIWVTDPGGRSRVRLTRDDVKDSYPVWSPDGRKIAFVRGGDPRLLNLPPARSTSSEIYVMNADGTEVTRLTHNRTGEGFPAWQPRSGNDGEALRGASPS